MEREVKQQHKDDMDWLKNEISDIKDGMEGIADQLRENVNFLLLEIICQVEQLKWALA